MLKLLLINSVTFFLLSYFGIGLHVDSFTTAIFAAFIFGVLNIFGILILLPFAFFGWVGLILYEALLIWLISLFLAGFVVTSFPLAILIAIILGVVNGIFK